MHTSLLSFTEDDVQMRFAIEEAQRTLKQFFDSFSRPKPDQEHFLVKVQFSVAGQVEHIWVADIDASVSPLQGTLANETDLPGLKFMERVEFHPTQITDWMYVESGYLVGGYTTQVVRNAMSMAERAEYDAAAPYRFRNAL